MRQTLLATNLASGALAAWKLPPEKLEPAFDFMFREDPFSGHVVLRSTDGNTAGSEYKLWTTLKAPRGFSLQEHAALLARHVGAEHFRLMPAKGIFVLGVGHVRRKTVEPGERADAPAQMTKVEAVELDEREWRVLLALKRELSPEEIHDAPWIARAREAGVGFDEFCDVARSLQARKLIGRFSTFLEHVKPSETGVRVTRFNALYHWAVPPGREIEAGGEVGRHLILTHCYWREGGRISATSTSWPSRTARRNRACSRTRRPSTTISARAASRCPTPTCSGAGAARSSPRRFRRSSTANGRKRWRRVRRATGPVDRLASQGTHVCVNFGLP